MRALERHVMLRTIDTHWMDHLTAMENSRQSIGLEAYGQRDPLVAYKRRSHLMFEELTARIRMGIVRTLFRVDVRERAMAQVTAAPATTSNGHGQANGATANASRARGQGKVRSRDKAKAVVGKVGRNAPCPCGSGQKYKRCHGA